MLVIERASNVEILQLPPLTLPGLEEGFDPSEGEGREGEAQNPWRAVRDVFFA